jgi:hypothetical protein
MVRARRVIGLTVVGGCCGTDPTHLDALAELLTDADRGPRANDAVRCNEVDPVPAGEYSYETHSR